jgi:hypothetical protein
MSIPSNSIFAPYWTIVGVDIGAHAGETGDKVNALR